MDADEVLPALLPHASGWVLSTALEAASELAPGIVDRLGALDESADPSAKLAALLGAIHGELGADPARAWLTAHGKNLAERLADLPEHAALRDRIRTLDGPQQLEFAAHGAVSLAARLGLDARVDQSRGALLLSLEDCPVCARFPAAREPLCANLEVLFTSLVRAYSGQSVTAAEVECRAEGGRACRFRIRA